MGIVAEEQLQLVVARAAALITPHGDRSQGFDPKTFGHCEHASLPLMGIVAPPQPAQWYVAPECSLPLMGIVAAPPS